MSGNDKRDKKQPEPKFLLGLNRDKLGGGMSPAEYDKKRKQAQMAGIVRSLLMLGGLVVVTVLFARRTAAPGVEQVTTASGLDANQEPVGITDSFGPGDTVYVSVEAVGYEAGSEVAARVTYAGEAIAEIPVDEGLVSELYIGWAINPADVGWEVWETGGYTVEIVFRGRQVLGSAAFTVTSDE